MRDFLPVTPEDMKKRGWSECDFVYITGDGYVDHPSFGTAIISRVLESKGFKVGLIPQPNWRDDSSVKILGRPKLGFLISSGNMDSMVNHYTVNKRKRRSDAYTPGGEIGRRPDRACIVYGSMVRRLFPDVPIIMGGIEASLRRFAHYDYWSDTVKRSILIDSGADIISYGMGERSITELAEALRDGTLPEKLPFIRGIVYKSRICPEGSDILTIPDFKSVSEDKTKYEEAFMAQYNNSDPYTAKRLVQPHGKKEFIISNPPSLPLTEKEMDEVYALPYMRDEHPLGKKMGHISAFDEVRFSITSQRGCFGSCNFCALTFHQGRIIRARSKDSVIREAEGFLKDKAFKGYIHDVGGPTANFRHPSCRKQLKNGTCKDKRCLFPKPCESLDRDQDEYADLLKELGNIPGIKKVFVRSGIRFDYLLLDKKEKLLRQLVRENISGQLKVAPEHVSDNVLKYMGKPGHDVYRRFLKRYKEVCKEEGKDQYVIPYLMSSHPGSTVDDAIELLEYLVESGFTPEQVQDFYPTPSTLSTCMYYTERDPFTKEHIYVAKTPEEKKIQRALMQYKIESNISIVKEALKKAGREDLAERLYGAKKHYNSSPDKTKRDHIKTPKKKKTIRNVHKRKINDRA